MKDGMRKFTKVCLITALAVFILGCVICLVCAMLGGFRQLRNLDVQELTGIPFFYYRNDGFFYGFGDDGQEWDPEWEYHKNWEQVDAAEKIRLGFTADTLRNLEIEAGACELYVEESEDDHVWLAASGDTSRFRYHEDGDTLHLVRREEVLFWNWVGRRKNKTVEIYLYLPRKTVLNDVDIEFGAGTIDSIPLRARDIHMETGACVCNIEGLLADRYVEMRVGAGQINLNALETQEAVLEIGAGELYLEGARILEDADVEVGMGNVEMSGLILGDLDADCGMGSLTLQLEDSEQDHNYEIECAMGSVQVGRTSYAGLVDDKSIDNGSRSTYKIQCAMGEINVFFAQ